jgi:hypothetical protein
MRQAILVFLLSGVASAQIGVPYSPSVSVSVGTGWNQQVQWGVSVGNGYPQIYNQGYPVYSNYPAYQVPVYNLPVYTQPYPYYTNSNYYYQGNCAPRYSQSCPPVRYQGWGRRGRCR